MKHPRKEKQAPMDLKTEIELMKEERRVFYEGQAEIEKLKKAYYEPIKTKNEEIKNLDEMLTILTNSKDSHPGKKIFKKKNKYQCFTLDSLFSDGLNDYDFAELKLLLQTKLISNENLSADILSKLYYLMSIESDELTCESCCEILEQNLQIWSPALEDIFKVILNWGATFESLELTNYEKSIIFPNLIYMNPQAPDSIIAEFCFYNYDNVFSYLICVVSQTEKFSEQEKVILIKYTLQVILDIRCRSVSNVLKNFIGTCINSIKKWDFFKVINISAAIHNRNEHFHNQIAIVMDIIPKISRCNPISSCLSLTVLRMIVNNEVKYIFPYEDEEVLDLMKMIEVNPNDGEELYKLYMIIHLLNHIVYHKNMIGRNENVMENLKNTVESLKWEVAKSKRIFDADLLKGRISYCSTVWSLFSKKNVPAIH